MLQNNRDCMLDFLQTYNNSIFRWKETWHHLLHLLTDLTSYTGHWMFLSRQKHLLTRSTLCMKQKEVFSGLIQRDLKGYVHKQCTLHEYIVVSNPSFAQEYVNFDELIYPSLTVKLSFQVALQFPDELLADAASVTSTLTEQTESKIFILGDTSYGRYVATQ